MKRICLYIILIILSISLHAQTISHLSIQEYLEYILENGSSQEYDDLMEIIDQLQEHPININDSTQAQQLFFLDEIQQRRLRIYIQEYGELFSINELNYINGFDSTTISLVRLFAVAQPSHQRTPLKIKDIIKYGHSSLLIGGNQYLEQSRAYRDSIYEGNPLHLYFLYQFRYKDKIQIQLSGDKDPGESLFKGTNPQGFDFYGGHILLNDIGIVSNLIIGQYRLQFGQGLTLWTGYQPYNIMNINLSQNAQGIRPSSAFTEYNYLQGVASTIALSPQINLTTFYSNVDRDSVSSPTGYHRYPTETRKERLRNEQLLGYNIQYHNNYFSIGNTLQYIQYDKAIEPKPNQYNQYYFRGNSNYNIGIDASYLYQQILLFGEVSMSKNNKLACIGGIQIPISNNLKLGSYYRYYDKAFQNQYSAALGQNASPQNENGICFVLQAILPHNITAHISSDFFTFPSNKYQVYSPSHGQNHRIRLEKSIGECSHISCSYNYKSCGRNGEKDIQNQYTIEQTHKHQLTTCYNFSHKHLKCTSRLSYTLFNCDQHNHETGICYAQDIQYNTKSFDIIGRFAIFNISDYDARIYLYENDLSYQYNYSPFLDQGVRFSLIAKYHYSNAVDISLKYAITTYDNKETIGSGYDITYSNHRQIVKLQLKYHF